MARRSFKHDPSIRLNAEEFLRSLVGNEVGILLSFDPIARLGRDPEGIHQLRVCARRLRSELKVMAPALKAAPLSSLLDELQWMGRVLGGQRDLDVLFDLLKTVNVDLSPPLEHSVFRNLRQRQATKKRKVEELLASKRYRHLVGTLADAALHPPLRGSGATPAIEFLRPGLERTVTKLFTAVEHFGPEPTNLELHQIRILAKRARYSAEVASMLLGEPAKDLGASLERVQSVLGNLHDCCVAIEYLEGETFLCPEGDFTQASQSVRLATQRLDDSIEDLKTKWREPVERARTLAAQLFDGKNQSDDAGAQHEVK